MKLKNIIVEDFINYKLPSMFLITCSCNWKCCKEAGNNICQNMEIAKEKNIKFNDTVMAEKYSQYCKQYK